MSNVISIITGKPIDPCNDTGARYFRVTSASQTISARRKRETLLNSGWSVYDGETICIYSNPMVSNNDPFFLDDAFNAQILMEHGQRYWKS